MKIPGGLRDSHLPPSLLPAQLRPTQSMVTLQHIRNLLVRENTREQGEVGPARDVDVSLTSNTEGRKVDWKHLSTVLRKIWQEFEESQVTC